MRKKRVLVVVALLGLVSAGAGCRNLAPGPKGKKVTGVRSDFSLVTKIKEDKGIQPAQYNAVILVGYEPPAGGEPRMEALRMLTEMVEGKRVTLEYDDPETPDYNPNGQLLAYMLLGDLMVQEELIKEGLGTYSAAWGGERYKERLLKAQDEARRAGLGVWAE